MSAFWRARIPGLVLLAISTGALSQTLVEWSEGPGRLGLGYPVPVPVDTPLPFDGFRSQSGLHARHQSLDLASSWLSSEVVGQTRKGRDIWLYQFGDHDSPDAEGRSRPVVFFNGGIHAREWQSPEVVTGLMELLVEQQDRDGWISYIRDNVSVQMIPVLNVDGFLQTQRYPRSNYLDSDPQTPQSAPRDGRMRRKNHFNADENLPTTGDHLFGVDLNRNNEPFWPGPAGNALATSLVYRGTSANSEPETQALHAAAGRFLPTQMHFYADMHSFGRVMFAVDTGNTARRQIQSDVLSMAIQHHRALPGAKVYGMSLEPVGTGIGTTSEYFAHRFQVPSLTWELEPGNGGAVEYGGFGTNGHDGFILPESQIRRVRENMAQTMAAVAYHMAGPPHMESIQVTDTVGASLIVDHRWSVQGDGGRQQQARSLRPLQPGHPYSLRLGFNKPMRWRSGDDQVVPFPGQTDANLAVDVSMHVGDQSLDVELGAPVWLSTPAQPGTAGRTRYNDDAVRIDFMIRDTPENRDLLQEEATTDAGVNLSVNARDMTGRGIDADPATAVNLVNGQWQGYETLGSDRSHVIAAALTPQTPVFPIDPGHSATWYDPSRSGEGFFLENLDGSRAVAYWFTYDLDGNQRWLMGLGFIEGNRVRFPDLFETVGGRFGSEFDPGAVTRQRVGAGDFWFEGCDHGWFDFEAFGQRGQFELGRTSRTMSVDCDPNSPEGDSVAAQSGSWYDPSRSGEGFALQWMTDGRAIMTWYTFDSEGNPYWMLGVGETEGDEIVFADMHATRGGRFGAGFDPDAVERFLWGEVRMRLACATGEVTYQSVLPAFGSGTLQIQRLTGLAGLACPSL